MDIVLGIDSLGKGDPDIKSFTGALNHGIAIHAFANSDIMRTENTKCCTDHYL